MSHATIDLHVNPSDETIRLGPVAVRFLQTGDNSGGTSAQPRPLRGDDQWRRRCVDLDRNGNPIAVGPGQALCIPRGAIHRFDNNGSQDVRALCLITPAAIGPQFFRESADVINAAAGGPPDRAKMAEVMRRHGLTPAPPPSQTERNLGMPAASA
jgi:hypothetical protein